MIHVGQLYDWPEWLLQGSDFSPGRPIPQIITLADELRLIANLFDYVEPLEFSARMMRVPLAGMGPMSALCFKVAPSLAAALELQALRNSRSAQSTALNFSVTEDVGVLTASSKYLDGRLFDAMAIALLSFFYSLSEALAPAISQTAKLEVTFRGRLECFFASEISCPVTFGAPVNQLIIGREALDRANPDFDRSLWTLVEHNSGLASTPTQPDLTAALEVKVRAHLDQHRVPRLKQIADEMGVSERTIVRLLHADGQSFRLLVDEERKERAIALLADRSVDLTQISELLGFSDRPSFWRTFRRWFGVTPSEYRRD